MSASGVSCAKAALRTQRALRRACSRAQVIDGSGEALQAVVAQAAWAMGKGVAGGAGAAMWLNGLLMASDGGLGWHQMVPFALQMEQQRLQVRRDASTGGLPGHVGGERACRCAAMLLLEVCQLCGGRLPAMLMHHLPGCHRLGLSSLLSWRHRQRCAARALISMGWPLPQEAAYFGRLQDSEDDVLEAILRIFKAVPKHNPRLLEPASDDDDEPGSGAVRQASLLYSLNLLRFIMGVLAVHAHAYQDSRSTNTGF